MMQKNLFSAVLPPILAPGCGLCGGNVADEQLCIGCQNEVKSIAFPCKSCGASLPEDTPLCLRCIQSPSPIAQLCPLWDDLPPLSWLLRRLKYRADLRVLGLLSAWLALRPRSAPAGVVVPIPGNTEHVKARGLDHAALIAEVFAIWLQRPLELSVLLRNHDTGTQTGRGRKARAQALKGAFAVMPDTVHNRDILLVDDIVTSGATLFEAAHTLRAAGAGAVNALVVAHHSRGV